MGQVIPCIFAEDDERASESEDGSPWRRVRTDECQHVLETSVDKMMQRSLADLRRVIVVLGPPACGKTTLCECISREFGLAYVLPDEIFRQHVEQQTPVGLEVRDCRSRGQLVSDRTVTAVMKNRLACVDVAMRGCVIVNFPQSAAQAAEFSKCISEFISEVTVVVLEVPEKDLYARASGRLVDPQTGGVYHKVFRAAPQKLKARLQNRRVDRELFARRVAAYRENIDSVIDAFPSTAVLNINAARSVEEIFGDVRGELLQRNYGPDTDRPYIGSKAFGGRFSAAEARKHGFLDEDEAEEAKERGNRVVCFRRGPHLWKYGLVESFRELESDGADGLLQGELGTWTTVKCRNGPSFGVWSVFLTYADRVQYSDVCSTARFQASSFCMLYECSRGATDADPVSAQAARKALPRWLDLLAVKLRDEDEDSDEEPNVVTEETKAQILNDFDSHENPTLFLYSTNRLLGPRVSRADDLGGDFSYYFRALNNSLNSDSEELLTLAMPIIQHMVYDILYDSDGKKRLHQGGTVWKGDCQRATPLNMDKLVQANRMGTAVRFRQFQSTTTDKAKADKYRKREEGSRGFLWEIDVRPGFWGARDITQIACIEGEAETLFPPYAAFLVDEVSQDFCKLRAVERTIEMGHRLRSALWGEEDFTVVYSPGSCGSA